MPDDVAVVGYDDLGVAERTTPPLTTVRQPISEMAERATRLLLEQIDGTGPGGPMRVMIQPRRPARQRLRPSADPSAVYGSSSRLEH